MNACKKIGTNFGWKIKMKMKMKMKMKTHLNVALVGVGSERGGG